MKAITKEMFLNALACPSLGWMMRTGNTPPELVEDKASLATQWRMAQGLDIQNRARALFSDVSDLSALPFGDACSKTAQLVADKSVHGLFEAAFLAGDCTTRADLIAREGRSWRLTEIKSRKNESDELVDDTAYTLMVLGEAGMNVAAVALMLVSPDFRLGMPDDELFLEIDVTIPATTRAVGFLSRLPQVVADTSRTDMPCPELRLLCKKCPLCGICPPTASAHHILQLPYLREERFQRLLGAGITDIRNIPDDSWLTPKQSPMWQAALHGKTVVLPGIDEALDEFEWPASYLDFETFSTAIPPYPDVAPYTQLPFLYSVHKCASPGSVTGHLDYLADPQRDCSRELTERLIEDLSGRGSIVVYSSYEKTTINALAQRFPDLSDVLSDLAHRMVDLKRTVDRSVYHPEFHGSASIKSVLPALVPEFSYAGMAIADGDSASAAFAFLNKGGFWNEDDVPKVRQDLRAYCALDTLAMVKIHEEIAALTS